MLIIYLAVLIVSLYYVSKILGPELNRPSLPNIPSTTNPSDNSQYNSSDNRIKKLETLLAEKNKNIQLLQTELNVFQVQIRGFEKVKTLLDEEIHRLKEQNRMFRSELGLPSIASSAKQKENSIT